MIGTQNEIDQPIQLEAKWCAVTVDRSGHDDAKYIYGIPHGNNHAKWY